MLPKFDALLDELLASLPEASVPPAGAAVETAAVIRRIAEQRGNLAACRPEVNALCRKLEVGGVVRESYGPAWRRIPGAAAIDPGQQTLFAAALLACADRHLAAEDESLGGGALKCLNAALKALDGLAGGGDPRSVAALAAWAEQLVGDVGESATR